MQLPKISFIIPTLNAQHILPKCLHAIRTQQYPQKKIEIIVADGGSTDKTIAIAKKYKAKIINNPEVLHEPGKSRASKIATGDILFYTDADNILARVDWITHMVKPYIDNPNIMGFLPQTIPAPDTNAIDRYLGFLFTDPFTWFIYYPAANPMDYDRVYTPKKITKTYKLYKFPVDNPPLFGLSQGVGTNKCFIRSGFTDDLLAGIKLIEQEGLVAYVPQAGVYHYHISGISHFIKKYSWRLQNNFTQHIQGMGIVNRTKFFPLSRKIRMLLFIPYAISIIFPLIDAIRLSRKHRDTVMFLHIPMSFIMATIIVWESVTHIFGVKYKLTAYE